MDARDRYGDVSPTRVGVIDTHRDIGSSAIIGCMNKADDILALAHQVLLAGQLACDAVMRKQIAAVRADVEQKARIIKTNRFNERRARYVIAVQSKYAFVITAKSQLA